ncbi:LysR family transcriptional regulator [Vibrio sp. Of7-15]|uniref:LysR family transcriptional regulator n=1 Tax=Vibrio sp. Of7-15 TaxID=2724879 RepID=UPI001EF1FA0F|nr:LysR family transcriptional regulator [Vibrio sp. Of7-15]MCG7499420.1 LysR family transcriptional regulator [Vibrio sp. Of7-15]
MDSIFGNLDDLYLFCRVVDAGSLLKASEQLQLPVSTMSRRLTSLEKRIGVRLLERQGRELSATETGQVFYARMGSELSQIELDLHQLLSDEKQVKGNVRLVVPYTMYQSFVGDVVQEFMLTYPEVTIDVKLSLDDSMPETDRDLVVGFNLGRSTDLIARPYFMARDVLYASCDYIEKHGMPTSIEESLNRDWVGLESSRELHFMQDNGQSVSCHMKPRMVVNDVKMLVKAVSAGIGIGAIPRHHVPSDDPTLVKVLPELQLHRRQAFLYYKRREHQPKALSLLIQMLLERAPKLKN